MGVRANADTPEDARKAREFGAEGIGLVRTEHMFFAPDRIAIVREMIMASDHVSRRAAVQKLLPFQRDDFLGIFRAMDGLPVTIRLLDPPLHEFLANPKEYREMLEERARLDALDMNPARKAALDEKLAKIDSLREANPMLGHRGCRLGITSPEIYAMQVRAIMEAACTAAEQGVKVEPEIMIPLTGTVGEMKLTCENTRKVAESALVEMGVPVKYTIGTMIEVPRAALIADKIAQDAEFFSFGTNDLTQMTFGYSRDDVAKFLPDYLQKGLLQHDPFSVLDQEGVGELIKIGIERGRRTRPGPQDRHLRRARRRAVVGRVLSQGGHDLRVVLAVHDSHRAPQRRPGSHQAARGLGRRRAQHIGDRRVKLPGARVVLECLKREGVDTHLRPARRRRPADLRRAVRLRGAAPHPRPPGGGRRPRRRGLRARDRQGRRVPGDLGARLHESGDRAAGRPHGLDPDRRASPGRCPRTWIGNDAFQEADNVGITRSATKHNFLVKDGKDLGPIIREAFHIASTGRPGPVHVDLPKDILVKETELIWPEKVTMRSYNPNYDGHPGQIKRAARAMVRAKRPVLYVGGGVISSDAHAELRELAELTQIPVTTTLMGLGAFPSAHPLSLEMLGMHGTYYANMAVHHSDVLVAVGARFDDRVTGKVDAFAPHAEIIHIDIDPSSIAKNIKVDVPIVGDCRRVLKALIEAVQAGEGRRRRPARSARPGTTRSPTGSATSRSATSGATTSSSPST